MLFRRQAANPPPSGPATPSASPAPTPRSTAPEPPDSPLLAALAWAAGLYSAANIAGVVLAVILAVSGPAFSIDTPLFDISALASDSGKQTSYHIHLVPFLLSSAAFGAAAATLRSSLHRS